MERLLTTEEAARLLSHSRHTLDAWRKRGGGPRYVKLKHAVRYRMEDIEAFVDAAERNHTSGASA